MFHSSAIQSSGRSYHSGRRAGSPDAAFGAVRTACGVAASRYGRNWSNAGKPTNGPIHGQLSPFCHSALHPPARGNRCRNTTRRYGRASRRDSARIGRGRRAFVEPDAVGDEAEGVLPDDDALTSGDVHRIDPRLRPVGVAVEAFGFSIRPWRIQDVVFSPARIPCVAIPETTFHAEKADGIERLERSNGQPSGISLGQVRGSNLKISGFRSAICGFGSRLASEQQAGRWRGLPETFWGRGTHEGG